MKTATVTKFAAQGDVLFLRVENLPEGVVEEKTRTIAHSETGHHHTVRAPEGAFAYFRESPMIGYLQCDAPIEIVHERQVDAHKTICLAPGVWQVKRQREWAPEGWRMVED